MIPYFKITTLPLGPLQIQVWGLMVSLGVIGGLLVGLREAVSRGISKERFVDAAAVIVLAALIGGRLGYIFLYDLSVLDEGWFGLVTIWKGGMSSFGGFIGALIGGAVFCRLKRIPLKDIAVPAMFGTTLGYGIGRIGCFLIHDHPGVRSTFWLAVRYPDGPRLDHGLLLSLLGFGIFLSLVLLRRFSRSDPGLRYIWWTLLLYGSFRFWFDFYRAWDLPGSDLRLMILTPAQYGSSVFVLTAVWFLIVWPAWRRWRHPEPSDR